jgi:hypothetical protein
MRDVVPMKPTFQTRAVLNAWAQRIARECDGDRRKQLKAVDLIRSVTLAHMYLLTKENINV